MKKSVIFILLSVLMISMLGCGESTTTATSASTTTNNITTTTTTTINYFELKGKYTDIVNIYLFDENDVLTLDEQSLENNRNQVVYKYKMVNDPSKFVYSRNYERRADDTSETVHSVEVYLEGKTELTTCDCYYIGEAGLVGVDVDLQLFLEDNFLKMKVNTKNISLNDTDYHQYLKQIEAFTNYNEQNMINEFFEDIDYNYYLNGSFSYLLDLNNYKRIMFQKQLNEDEISNDIVPLSRKGIIDSNYFISYKINGDIEYILGGKNNKLDLAQYISGEDIKYIPHDYDLPGSMIINDKEYTMENDSCGSVLLEMDVFYSFESFTIIYEEKNYKPYFDIEEEVYNKFIQQGETMYIESEVTHIINPNKPVEFAQKIDENKLIIFVYVE